MLEGLVRPFQSPNAIATRRAVVATSNKQPAQIAQLIWGAAGAMPTAVALLVSGGINANIDSSNLTGDTQNAEKKGSRVVVQKRIENPDNPDQYVMVEDTQAITFAAKPKAKPSATQVIDPTTGVVSTPTLSVPGSPSAGQGSANDPHDVSFSFLDQTTS